MYTDLSGSLGNATELPPAFVTAATRLHERLGAPPAGTAYEVYLCHVFCELGAVPMVDEMRTLRGFLDRHPDEVVVMVIEDHVPADRIAAVLRDAGLEPKLLPVTDPSALPSLGDMLSSGHPLQVSLENGDGGPTLPNAFAALVQETPFTFRRPRDLEAASSCRTNRGPDGAPVFQLNHWVTPAEPFTAGRVNSSVLRSTPRPLHRAAGAWPDAGRGGLRRAGRPVRRRAQAQPVTPSHPVCMQVRSGVASGRGPERVTDDRPRTTDRRHRAAVGPRARRSGGGAGRRARHLR